MNLQRLRYFHAAVEYGSLRKAAEALSISQPSLSRQIQVLEREFKAPLFLRNNKRVSLTPAGQMLATRVGAVLRDIAELQADIAELSREKDATMKVGAIQSTCDYLLPRAIRFFRSRYPSVKIAVHGSGSAEIIEKVGRGLLDVGIVAAPLSDPRLVASSLADDPFILIVSRSHRYAKLSEIPLAYLEGEPFIGFPRGYPIRERIEEVAAETGFNLDVVVELESIEAIKELVRQGAGFSFLPSSSLLGENIRRELSCIRICGNPIVREIIEVHKASDPVSRHIVLLRETIQQSLARGMKEPIAVLR